MPTPLQSISANSNDFKILLYLQTIIYALQNLFRFAIMSTVLYYTRNFASSIVLFLRSSAF